jgi:folate-binding protein YgfZ
MAIQVTGYQALRESAALISLSGRGHIRVIGEDRARLLHAMTTNHVQQLQPGQSLYAFFLSAQGRILADVNILCGDDALLLDTEPETHQAVFQHLDRFIIADDVTLADETEHTAVFGLEGPGTPAILDQLGVNVPPAPHHWTSWRLGMVAGISATGAPGVRFFVPKPVLEELRACILGLGVVEATAEEWNVVRVENARPRYGVDITEAQIPQETQLLSALHFSKGCYLGQEIVERVRSRGHVNKKLMQMEIGGDVAHVVRKLTVDGRDVGDVTSAVWSPANAKVIALGYLRVEAANNPNLRCGDLTVKVTSRTPA